MVHVELPNIRRRKRRPLYVRPTVPDWTYPGGIVWVGMAIWLLAHLAIYGITAGFAPFSGSGVPYRLEQHRFRPVDIRRVLGGRPVHDLRGEVVVDPGRDTIDIVAMDGSGKAELRFRSSPNVSPSRAVVVIVPSTSATYQDVVSAIDQALCDSGRDHIEVFLAKPM